MKLSVKKKPNAKGNRLCLRDYDVLIDGESVNGEFLLGMNLSMPAGEIATLTLEYHVTELELDNLSITTVKKTH